MGESMLASGNTKKYNIPIGHLDYSYIAKSTDVKEIEKILKILRSGDEGCYPQLESLAEKRLTELAPTSRVLRKEIPISKLSDLDPGSRKDIEDDIDTWNTDIKNLEGLLTSGSDITFDNPDLPPVRSQSSSIQTNQKEKPQAQTSKRTAPRDFKEWDKLNIDEELDKVDEQTVKTATQKSETKYAKQGIESILSGEGLTEVERSMKANREKDKGNEAFRCGDYDESVLYYTRSISLSPTTASYNNRALAYLKQNKWDKSLEDLQKVLSAEPDNVKGLLRRGTSYKGKQEFKKAAKDLQRVLDLEPTNKKAEVMLKEMEDDRKVKGRRLVIEDVEEEEVTSEPTIPVSSRCQETIVNGVLETDVNKDQSENERVKAEDGEKSTVAEEVSSVRSERLESDGSEKSIVAEVSSVREEHHRPVFRVATVPPAVVALRLSGNSLFRAGQYSDALTKYQEAINELDTNSDGHEVTLSLIYSNQAACKLKMGDCSSAIADCTSALDLLPHSFKALLRRASAYEMKERYHKAYADYRHVLSIDSTSTSASDGTSRCQKHLTDINGHRWREKLPPLTNVFPWEIPEIVDPSSPQQPQAKRIQPSKDSAKTKTVVKSESQKLKETPSEIFDRLKSEGNKFVQKGEFRSAIDSYTKCLSISPEAVAAYTNRALCYLRLNKPTDAINDCEKALQIEVLNTKALYRRAQARKMLGLYKDSLADLLNLLKVEPNNIAAKKEVEVVKQYYKKEYEKSKLVAKEVKPARRKVKIELEDDDEDTAASSTSSPTKTQCPTSVPDTTERVPPAHSPANTKHMPKEVKSTSGKKSKKSKSKGAKATTGTGLPVVPPTNPTLGKATPYEFLQVWTSMKASSTLEPFTALLEQLKPADLPKLVSNKLDGDMLHKFISCVKIIVDKGDTEQSYLLLRYLRDVERFKMVQMFMSSEEKRDMRHICSMISRHESTAYTTLDITVLKKDYGS